MAQDLEQEQKNLFQRINSISFLTVTNDDGRQILSIPSWTVALGIILLVVFIRSRRSRHEDEE